MTEIFCCCKSGKKSNTCCGPYLSGQAIPATPEQLMRSRYAAFFHKNIDYLIATRDPDHRQENDRQVLADTCNTTQWLGLVVMETDDSQLALGVGYVEFAAFYDQKDTGQIHGQIHEKARFLKKDGRWVYCDGQMIHLNLSLQRTSAYHISGQPKPEVIGISGTYKAHIGETIVIGLKDRLISIRWKVSKANKNHVLKNQSLSTILWNC